MQEKSFTRRIFLTKSTLAAVGAVFLPVLLNPKSAFAASQLLPLSQLHVPKDLENLDEMEKLHVPRLRVPEIAEDGANVPVIIQMDHPMEPDHYIKSLKIMNYSDPVIYKGTFYYRPENGEVYLSTQIRMNGGDTRIWAVADCNRHGKWVGYADLKVAIGGC
jgi:sulfur-oxidizing protein SoxY